MRFFKKTSEAEDSKTKKVLTNPITTGVTGLAAGVLAGKYLERASYSKWQKNMLQLIEDGSFKHLGF